jgi:putative ABC transport system permease protein
MTAAGLLLRTLLSLDRGDAGYHADHVVTMSVQVPIRRVTAQSALADYFQAIENEVRIVPGVRAAAFVSDVPLAGLTRSQTFDIVGAPASDPATRATAHYQIVTPGYFDTMGIPLLGGRALTSDDASTAPPVCVVNEAFAHRYFGTAGAIGAHLTVDTIELPPRHVTREIVGVIRQVKMRPDEAPDNALEIYVPLAQNVWSQGTLVVRAAADPMRLMPSIQKAIARVDRTQVITRVRTMDDVAADSTARPRFRAQLVGTFAGLALVLAAAGIFSVLMFTVSQRSREFSVRIALGARTSDILRLVLGGALALTAIGVTTGAAAAAVTVRSLNSLLFGVTSLDPLTFTVAAVGVGVIGLAACVVPAIRALGSDPAVALRAQ